MKGSISHFIRGTLPSALFWAAVTESGREQTECIPAWYLSCSFYDLILQQVSDLESIFELKD